MKLNSKGKEDFITVGLGGGNIRLSARLADKFKSKHIKLSMLGSVLFIEACNKKEKEYTISVGNTFTSHKWVAAIENRFIDLGIPYKEGALRFTCHWEDGLIAVNLGVPVNKVS